MDAENWARIGELFNEVLDSENRETLLGAIVAADRLVIEDLLCAHSEMSHFLALPAPILRADIFGFTGECDTVAGEILEKRYRIEHEIGRGGFGAVYRAADLHLDGMAVAIKLLHDYWTASAWMRMRFQQEMKALSRVSHPAVVAITDFGETESGRGFLVMELINGPTLRTVLEEGPLDWGRTAAIIEQIGDALESAHESNVLHRDLKPENIILADGESPKIVDFGIARIAEAIEGTRMSTVIVGTPEYMAPEQFSGHATTRSDIYSLAVLAKEMVTGVRPRVEAARPETGNAAQFPRRIERVLTPALSQVEAMRPDSARRFAKELASALRSAPSFGERLGRRRLVALGGTLPIVAIGGWTARNYFGFGSLASSERLIENNGSQYPDQLGFVKRMDVEYTFAANEVRGGRDRMHLRSPDQGMFYHRLSRTQKAHACRRGFRLTSEIAPESGLTNVTVDLVGFGNRLDVCATRSGDGAVQIWLLNGIAPQFRFDTVATIHSPPTGLVLVDLRFDPLTQSASLAVDGVLRRTGYKGHVEFQQNEGVGYGCSLFRSDTASGFIRLFRFEILG
ncbi:MAG: serine/threonine-protein kinase [Paludibaculum sp.]